MTQPINNLFVPYHDDIYFSEGVLDQLEKHLHLLRTDPTARDFDVADNIRHKYDGDFYGLLGHFKIPPHLHRITARLNNLTNTMDYSEKTLSFKVPNIATIDKIVERYKLSKR